MSHEEVKQMSVVELDTVIGRAVLIFPDPTELTDKEKDNISIELDPVTNEEGLIEIVQLHFRKH